MPDPLMQSLLNGDVIGFVTACYTTAIGQGFYAMVLLMFFGPLYNRTKSVGLCAILWLLLGGAWITAMPEVSPIAVLLVTLGLVGVLYTLFGRSS